MHENNRIRRAEEKARFESKLRRRPLHTAQSKDSSGKEANQTPCSNLDREEKAVQTPESDAKKEPSQNPHTPNDPEKAAVNLLGDESVV